MIATKPINISEEYHRLAMQGEPILYNQQNLVLLSMRDYEELAKAKRNTEYLAKLDRSFEQLERGEVVHKTLEELRAIIDE